MLLWRVIHVAFFYFYFFFPSLIKMDKTLIKWFHRRPSLETTPEYAEPADGYFSSQRCEMAEDSRWRRIQHREFLRQRSIAHNTTVPNQPIFRLPLRLPWMRLPWQRVVLDGTAPVPLWVSYGVVIALSLSYFLAFLDQTILSTLTPRVPNDQEELFQTSWVTSSYFASLSAFMLFYGKTADIFGPLPVLLAALLIFLCGSVLTAASTTMVWLILARALAGLGAAGLISVTQTITAEVGPWHARGRYMGILGAVFGLSTTVGPLVGGLVADNWTWRISFYVNIPLVSVTLIAILLLLQVTTHPTPLRVKISRVDFFGALMLVAGLMLVLLGLNWGGRVYPWASPVVIICLVVGLLLLGVFVFVEGKLALEPIVDSRLLKIRNVALAIPTEMCVGAIFFNVTFNLPVYYSFTQNSSASESGVRMVPLACGVIVFSILSGWLIAIWGVYRLVAWAGTLTMTLGTGLLCLFNGHLSVAAQTPILVLVGSGIGCCIQAFLLAAQASVLPTDLAITTALVTFSQMLGGVMGLAFGDVISETSTRHYLDQLIEATPKHAADILKTQSDVTAIWSMDVPAGLRDRVIWAYAKGLQYNFVMLCCFGAMAAGLSVWLQRLSPHRNDVSGAGEFSRPGMDLARLDTDDDTLRW